MFGATAVRTWRHRLLDADLNADSVTLVSLRSGFAVAAETIEQTSRPVLLLSADGRSWRDHPFTAVRTTNRTGCTVGV